MESSVWRSVVDGRWCRVARGGLPRGGSVARVGPGCAGPPRKGTPMMTDPTIPSVYARLGVRPVIHAAGTTTRYGGSIMRPETIEAMREAAQALVNLDELNEA